MSDIAGDFSPIETTGTLQWNEFEGGFWSLDVEQDSPELGSTIVLTAFDPPAGAVDGTRLRVRVVPQSEGADFLMAGTRVDVLHAEIA